MEDDVFAAMLTKTMRDMQSQTRISEGKQPFNYQNHAKGGAES
jgi:hypothetical protein